MRDWYDRYIEADDKLERAFRRYVFWEQTLMFSLIMGLLGTALWYLAHLN